jgi:uncharacterized protein YbjT (DUF2867 family)
MRRIANFSTQRSQSQPLEKQRPRAAPNSHKDFPMIVLFGATGSIGPQLIRSLAHRNAAFRVAARNPKAARARLGAGVDIVQADVEKPETLQRALAGATQVFDSVGGASGTRQLRAAVCGLIDAAREARAQHYVHISGVRARPDACAEIQRIHGDIEARLATSGMIGTVLRGNFFMQNFLGLAPAVRAGLLPLPTGDARGALVDSRDIAEASAAVLTRPDLAGRIYTLTGPESLSHGEAAAILSRVLERNITFADVPARAFENSCIDAGLPDWFAFWLADVYEHVFAAGEAADVTGDVEMLTGHPPRSLAQFVRDHQDVFVG